jgi:hypothetical protein
MHFSFPIVCALFSYDSKPLTLKQYIRYVFSVRLLDKQ